MWSKLLALGMVGMLSIPAVSADTTSQSAKPGCTLVQEQPDPLVGKWQFYKIIYQGQERPPFNPNLILTFEFLADGSDILRWERTGERGFCERKGSYSFTNGELVDKVEWVNPGNNRDCGSDPDMRVGNVTRTTADLKNGEFFLYFSVNEESLVYVWKRLSP